MRLGLGASQECSFWSSQKAAFGKGSKCQEGGSFLHGWGQGGEEPREGGGVLRIQWQLDSEMWELWRDLS